MMLMVYDARNAQPIMINTDELVAAEQQPEGVTYITLRNNISYTVLDPVEDIYNAITGEDSQGE